MTSKIPQGETSLEKILKTARENYSNLTAALKDAEKKLRGSEGAVLREFNADVKQHWKSLHFVLELESTLEKRRDERAGIVHGYALDLASARTEIGQRLACLRDAQGTDDVFGGIDG